MVSFESESDQWCGRLKLDKFFILTILPILFEAEMWNFVETKIEKKNLNVEYKYLSITMRTT